MKPPSWKYDWKQHSSTGDQDKFRSSCFKEKNIFLFRENVAVYKLEPFVIWYSEKHKTTEHINTYILAIYYSRKIRLSNSSPT